MSAIVTFLTMLSDAVLVGRDALDHVAAGDVILVKWYGPDGARADKPFHTERVLDAHEESVELSNKSGQRTLNRYRADGVTRTTQVLGVVYTDVLAVDYA